MSIFKQDKQPTIERLKRRARALVRETGITHSAALDTIARQLGFTNWALLQSSRGGAQLLERKHQQVTFRDALLRLVERVTGSELKSMHRTGATLWISEADLWDGQYGSLLVTYNPILAERCRHPYQPHLVRLMTQFGFDEFMVFEDDDTLEVDDAGELVIPADVELFAPDTARKALHKLVASGHFDAEPEGVMAWLNDEAGMVGGGER